MRRGLFIASDEAAAYTQQISSDRIQKREAHLRWAAEVTQTINVDQLLSKPKLNGEYTNSEDRPVAPLPSPAAGPPPAPRPAAGRPRHCPPRERRPMRGARCRRRGRRSYRTMRRRRPRR